MSKTLKCRSCDFNCKPRKDLYTQHLIQHGGSENANQQTFELDSPPWITSSGEDTNLKKSIF